MTDEQQAIQLAEWLEKNPGEKPPEGIDPDVIEAVYALRPDLAPSASVGVNEILSRIQSGPFREAHTDPEETSNLIHLAETRKKKLRRWTFIGSIAAAACVLIIAIPQKEEAAKIGPQTQGPPEVYTTKSSDIRIDMAENKVAEFEEEAEEDLDGALGDLSGSGTGGAGSGLAGLKSKEKASYQTDGSPGSMSDSTPEPIPPPASKSAQQKARTRGKAVEANLESDSLEKKEQETDELVSQMLGSLDASTESESEDAVEFEEMLGTIEPAETQNGGGGGLKSRAGSSKSRTSAPAPAPAPKSESDAPTVSAQLNLGQAKVTAEDGESDKITSVINTKKGRIKQCYESELRHNPYLEGRVTIYFEIGRGRVLESKIIENTTGNLSLANCIKSKVDRLRFAKEVEASVEYPFVFTASR